MDELETNKEVVETGVTPETGSKVGEAQGDLSKDVVDTGKVENATVGDPAEVDGEEKVAEAYKPRDKYLVRVHGSDKQAEKEVPTWLKTLMKDADSEKQVIDLLERADGLEPVKAHRDEIRKERDTFKNEFTSLQTQVASARSTYQRGDIDGFLQQLNIPAERMLQWAYEKVQYSQLPPEQKQILDERTRAQREVVEAQSKAQTFETQLTEQVRSAKQNMLELGLRQPEVQQFTKAFEEKSGRAGSFQEEVIATGYQAYVQSEGKVDLSPSQAIELTMKKWGAFITPGQTQASANPQAVVTPATQAATQVIPNVQGGSKSPMKPKVRSIDDLKKLGAAAAAASS